MSDEKNDSMNAEIGESLRVEVAKQRLALALQFEEGDIVELRKEHRVISGAGEVIGTIPAGSILTVETTPLSFRENAEASLANGDGWVPRTAMCSWKGKLVQTDGSGSWMGNHEIPLHDLRLVSYDGQPSFGGCDTCLATRVIWNIDEKVPGLAPYHMCATCMVQHIISLEGLLRCGAQDEQ